MFDQALNPYTLQLLMSCGVTVALLVGLVTSWRDLALIGNHR